MKMPALLLGAVSVLLAGAATAQDISPVFDLPTLAQGQVIGSTVENHERQAARRGPTANQVQACAQRPRLRRQYGAGNPKLQHLERLCRGVGL